MKPRSATDLPYRASRAKRWPDEPGALLRVMVSMSGSALSSASTIWKGKKQEQGVRSTWRRGSAASRALDKTYELGEVLSCCGRIDLDAFCALLGPEADGQAHFCSGYRGCWLERRHAVASFSPNDHTAPSISIRNLHHSPTLTRSPTMDSL